MSETKTSPLRYIVPNAVTSMGITLGVFAIMHANAGSLEDAAWFILLCVLLDKLDGTAARLLKGSSSFGVQLDSFSDFISFGLAPAFLVLGIMRNPEYVQAYEGVGGIWCIRGMCVFFVMMSAFRLAKFNVMTEEIGSTLFLGIPTTLVGGMTASYVLTATKYGFDSMAFTILPVVLVVLGLWEVSNIPLPKIKKTESTAYNLFIAINGVAVYVVVPMQMFPAYIFMLGIGYAFVGTFYAIFMMKEQLNTARRRPAKVSSDGE